MLIKNHHLQSRYELSINLTLLLGLSRTQESAPSQPTLTARRRPRREPSTQGTTNNTVASSLGEKLPSVGTTINKKCHININITLAIKFNVLA